MNSLHEQLLVDISNLPSMFPNDPDRIGIKHVPSYLAGKTGTFHSNNSNAVQNIGECYAVAKFEATNQPIFADTEGRWWDLFIPHPERARR